ncbi:Hypothetical protein PHPALM_19988 [Phytophthora palmivora]|uniref:Uncharacterized protein n=1 Tax=Phytophthora palmivora TaxID=4796 RepID=A0A2P4XG06_9STRA|nr:Hypothetical protein PHPALM_19988 [Phytophthora palmivora]
MTHRGKYTPSRVPMRATDSVVFHQQTVEEVFRDEIHRGMLAWLGDRLGYAATEAELCDLFDRAMQKSEGVTHCPDRIQGLVDMAHLATAADLQQLLCAVNWIKLAFRSIRTSLDHFTILWN